jgi:cell wall-associated NlpC family hydrolase
LRESCQLPATSCRPRRNGNSNSDGRDCVVAIAKTWLGTPYHHMGRIKAVGVDCAMFPLEVYREAGLIGDVDVPYYPQDWMLHRSEEVYLHIVERHAQEIAEPAAVAAGAAMKAPPATAGGSVLPGDFVLYRFGRCWSHGAIVLEWPLIIHAVVQHGVILSDGNKDGMLVGRQRRLFSIFAKSKPDTDLADAARTDHTDASVQSVASV